MSVNTDWLWDRKISAKQVKRTLKSSDDKHFLPLAGLLLARKNIPKEVFQDYLKPVIFFKEWPRIKRQMRKDNWNEPRIEYWQAIYEKLKEKYRKKGIVPVAEKTTLKPENEFCKTIAAKLKEARKLKGLTQSDLAKRLKVSQQMVSRIEKGKENVSLLTLKKIADSLGAVLEINVE